MVRTPAPRCSLDDNDLALVAAAALVAASAGVLQATVSNGDKGLSAFLMKEKADNPFYSKDFKADKPKAPQWMSGIRLPSLPYVEVYGQASAPGSNWATTSRGNNPDEDSELSALYRQLDAAIDIADYDAAARIKAQIDDECP